MYVGAGHIELNLVRTIFREFFGIFIRPIAEKMGYASPRSMEYCRAAADHHKSWQILKVRLKKIFRHIVKFSRHKISQVRQEIFVFISLAYKG